MEFFRNRVSQRRVEVLEADQRTQGVTIARERHPDVIVVDLEDSAEDAPEVLESFADGSDSGDPSIVILGTARQKKTAAGSDFFTKPYHYAPLIRTIEQRLARCNSQPRP